MARKPVKINVFKVMGWVGDLAKISEKVSDATQDGVIEIDEALDILKEVFDMLGVKAVVKLKQDETFTEPVPVTKK